MRATITVTGADERTPTSELLGLSRISERVEIGLLYSETPEGRNRYPSVDWLRVTVEALGERCAVHVCGTQAREHVLSGPRWITRAGRVQFNGWYAPVELKSALQHYQSIIVQHDCEKRPDYTAYPLDGLSLLVDASGGRGILPARWERPDTSKPVGFAGGLGPNSLAVELPRIAKVAVEPWWVDCEGRLRTADDWFDVVAAERSIRTFLAFCEARQ